MIERYSKKEFPPYAFVPGRNPHPRSNPQGHMYGKHEEIINQIVNDNGSDSEHYLYGVDLFNYGYYWEAHEVWEGLWNAHKREGYTADFLKALIKMSAAGVKVKQGQPRGITEHSLAAQAIFKNIENMTGKEFFLGINLDWIITFIDRIVENVKSEKFNDKMETQIVFDEYIRLN